MVILLNSTCAHHHRIYVSNKGSIFYILVKVVGANPACVAAPTNAQYCSELSRQYLYLLFISCVQYSTVIFYIFGLGNKD
jgi:hypothetical protein